MIKNISTITLGFVVAVALALTLAVQASHAQESSPVVNFTLVNYIGQELFLDLDDVTYTVPGTDTAPEGGMLTLQLNTGEHKFAANVPGILGEAGEFTLAPGQALFKAARLDQTPPSIGPDGTLLAKPKDIVDVFDFDPNAQPAAETPLVDTWQPAAAADGQASLVWVNYIGDELTVDLNGQLYKVAPGTGDNPSRLQIDVAPGYYTYTASVPGGSINHEVTLVAGQVIGLSLTGTREERVYDVGEKYDYLLGIDMQVSQEDLTAQTMSVTEEPAAAPTDETVSTVPAEASEPAVTESPATAEGLLVKNYAGETLTFTINEQTYTIPNNDQLTIDLPAGSYNFTASRPFVATTGTVNLQPDQGIELSVAINIAGDVMSVYQN
ncbi:MAG: hypothetical protein KDJ52_22525 [Anaerolineae bacterium]|nr:hypothetical protein [Anaerolineae bacterium]